MAKERKAMTARELIEHLKKAPPDAKIVVSADYEGNGFALLEEAWIGRSSVDYNDDEDTVIIFPRHQGWIGG